MEHEHYSRISQLIVTHLTGELSETEQQELDAWINSSADHLRMMTEFNSIRWQALRARQYEEANKAACWARIQQRVAATPDAPPLPDLIEPRWVNNRRVQVLQALRVILLRWGTGIF
jgi:anti-sigma factor RsiW